MQLRTILIAVFALAVSFAGAMVGMQWLSGAPQSGNAPAVAQVPPLPPMSRASVIVVPVTITLAAIRDALEREAPRDFSGQRDNPAPQLISNATIGWTGTRAPLDMVGAPEAVAVSTVINGSLRATGQLSAQASGGLSNAIGGILGANAARSVEKFASRPFDQRADIRGNVTVTARPAVLANWRIDPNMAAQVSIADGGLSIAGLRLNVSHEVKPWLDRLVNEQVAKLTTRLRNDPFLEASARREWAKLCRSIPLGAARPD
ncbi:MAG: DUF4403 family protein, partial [Acetobacteraceae bacterium]|nr:DUF4403 family protein [Acetobacteraceae bacterium]